jgi:hypothetical protein
VSRSLTWAPLGWKQPAAGLSLLQVDVEIGR